MLPAVKLGTMTSHQGNGTLIHKFLKQTLKNVCALDPGGVKDKKEDRQ